MNRLSNWITSFIKIIFAVVIVYLFLLSIYSTSYITASYNELMEYTFFARDNVWMHMIVLVVTLLLFVLGKKLVKTKLVELLQPLWRVLRYGFPLLMFGILLFWIWSTDVRPAGDQYETFFAAQSLLLGDYSQFVEGGYIFIYPNQIGLMLLESILIRLFGARATTALLLLNVFSIMLTLYLLFRIVKLILLQQKSLAAFTTYVAVAIWLPLLFYVEFFYGNVIGLALSTAGLWFTLLFLQNHRWRYILTGAICVATAMQVKNNYLIILLAMLVVLIIEAIRMRSWRPLVGIIICVGVYIVSALFVTTTVERMTGLELNSGVPKEAWIAMGLQKNEERANGWYNGYNLVTYLQNECDANRTKEICVERIKSELAYMAANPDYALRFFGEKIASQWNNPTFQCFWIYKYKTTTKPGMEWMYELLNDNREMVDWLNMLQSLFLGGTLLYLLCNWRQIGLQQLLLPIAFLGGFFFHLIWEAKAQYTFTYFVLIIPYAVMGLSSMAEMICNTKSLSVRKHFIVVVAIFAAIVLIGAVPTKLAQDTWQLEKNSQLLDEWQWE